MRWAALVLAALVVPACGGRGMPEVILEFDAFFVSDGVLKGARGADVRDIDAFVSDWRAIPHKSIDGTDVTYGAAVGTIVYIKSGRILALETGEPLGEDNPHRLSREDQAVSLVALVDGQQVETSPGATYVFYRAAGGELRVVHVAQHVHDESAPPDDHELPVTIETGVDPATPIELRAPTNASGFAWYRLGTTLKRVELVRFPVTQVNVVSGADVVEEFASRSQERVVYRRSDGDLLESRVVDADDPAPSMLVDAIGTKLLGIAGDDVYYSVHDAGALSLRRLTLDGGGSVTLDGPFAATAVTFNAMVFTADRAVWGHVRDGVSLLRAYDSAGASSDLSTSGRTLTALTGVGESVVVFEEGGFVVARTDAGTLLGEASGSGAALHRLGATYDIALDLFFATPAARVVYATGEGLKSRSLAMGGELALFAVAAADGSFGARDVVAGPDGLFAIDATAPFSARWLGAGVPIGAR